MSTTSTTIGFDDSLVQLLQQDIFTSLGMDDLPDYERQELLDTMLATVKDRVLARVLDALSADERRELTRLVNAGQADAVSEFVAEHVPNLEALMNQEAIQYKAEMIQNAAHIRQLVGSVDDDQAAAPTTSDAAPSSDPRPLDADLPVPYVPPAVSSTPFLDKLSGDSFRLIHKRDS